MSFVMTVFTVNVTAGDCYQSGIEQSETIVAWNTTSPSSSFRASGSSFFVLGDTSTVLCNCRPLDSQQSPQLIVKTKWVQKLWSQVILFPVIISTNCIDAQKRNLSTKVKDFPQVWFNEKYRHRHNLLCHGTHVFEI